MKCTGCGCSYETLDCPTCPQEDDPVRRGVLGALQSVGIHPGSDMYWQRLIHALSRVFSRQPIPMRLPCPTCHELHFDEGEFATTPHHTHACQSCGAEWRPAVEPTVGVRFLPGFKNV